MKIKKDDRCRLRGNDYLKLKVHNILPKGSHGRNCILVECKVSAGSCPPNFDNAVIRTYRMIDLIKVNL